MSVGLVVKILGDVKGLGDSLDAGGAKVNAFGREISAGGIVKLAAFAAVGAVAIDTLKGWADAAGADRLEAEQLATAIAGAGAATGDWQAQVEAAIVAGENLAFTDSQVRDGLQVLTTATGDVKRSTELLATAQDLARLKGIDLATAANAVAKAENGQGTALAKLIGINAKGLTSTEILGAAQKKAAGQAEVYGKSSTGQAEKMGIKFDELTEKIGAVLLPVLDALVPVFIEIVDAIFPLVEQLLPPLVSLMRILAGVLGTVARAITPVIRFIVQLVTWLSEAISVVADFVASLGPVRAVGDFLGGLFGGSLPSSAPAGSGSAGGSITDARTFTVYASSADPDAVVRALRSWAALNGGRAALDRVLEAG